MLITIRAAETGDFNQFIATVRSNNWACRNCTFSLRTISFWEIKCDLGTPETLSQSHFLNYEQNLSAVMAGSSSSPSENNFPSVKSFLPK